MGSICTKIFCCFGLCDKKDRKKQKDKSRTISEKSIKSSAIARAALMTHTLSGKLINTKITHHLPTQTELKIIKYKKNSKKFNLIMSPPLNEMSKIADNLYLTSLGGINVENIKEFQINCIITIAYEVRVYQLEGIECIRVPIEDEESGAEQLLPYFDEVSDKIHQLHKNNKNTVVHCMAGMRRSAHFVIAYVMKYENKSLKESFIYVRSCRPWIRHNTAFFRQLIEYEIRLFGKTSVEMIETKQTDKNGKHLFAPDFIVNEFPNMLSSGETSIDESTDRTDTDHRISSSDN